MVQQLIKPENTAIIGGISLLMGCLDDGYSYNKNSHMDEAGDKIPGLEAEQVKGGHELQTAEYHLCSSLCLFTPNP